jgi:hypothetical protein
MNQKALKKLKKNAKEFINYASPILSDFLLDLSGKLLKKHFIDIPPAVQCLLLSYILKDYSDKYEQTFNRIGDSELIDSINREKCDD